MKDSKWWRLQQTGFPLFICSLFLMSCSKFNDEYSDKYKTARTYRIAEIVFKDPNSNVFAYYNESHQFMRANSGLGFDVVLDSRFLKGSIFDVPGITRSNPRTVYFGNYRVDCIDGTRFYKCAIVVRNFDYNFALLWRSEHPADEKAIARDVKLAKDYLSQRTR